MVATKYYLAWAGLSVSSSVPLGEVGKVSQRIDIEDVNGTVCRCRCQLPPLGDRANSKLKYRRHPDRDIHRSLIAQCSSNNAKNAMILQHRNPMWNRPLRRHLHNPHLHP